MAVPDFQSLMLPALEAFSGGEADVMHRVRNAAPVFLERVVVELLIAMGCGVDAAEGRATGRSDDGGIDGTIREAA